jgi:hypothetical protein
MVAPKFKTADLVLNSNYRANSDLVGNSILNDESEDRTSHAGSGVENKDRTTGCTGVTMG